jgi:E3 ubiquitin-protein ligase HUWE1
LLLLHIYCSSVYVYLLQMKFIEAILSNIATDDHCREFVAQKGLTPLIKVLTLPNLPLDFPTTHSCQAVASVCKAILVIKCN